MVTGTATKPFSPARTSDAAFRSSLFPNFDVAWVRFEGALPEGYRPIEMLSDVTALTKGAPLTRVGRGVASATDHDVGTMRTVDTVVDRYICLTGAIPNRHAYTASLQLLRTRYLEGPTEPVNAGETRVAV
jgi:hypothetical protein